MKLLLVALIACWWLENTSHARVSTMAKLWGKNVGLHVSQAMSGVSNKKLPRQFARIGFRGVDGKPLSEDEMFKLRHEIFNRENIEQKVKEEIAVVQEELRVGKLSEGDAQRLIHHVERARDKILALIAKKEEGIRAIELKHGQNFRDLGLPQPVFDVNDIAHAYIDRQRDKGLLNKELSSFGDIKFDTGTENLIVSLLQLRLPITPRASADIRAKIREMSTKYSKELEVLGISPNHKNTFTRLQLEKIGEEINNRFPATQGVDTNDSYLELKNAFTTIFQATLELEDFLITNSWHSAMFDVLADKRIASLQHANELLSVSKLFHLKESLQLLDIDLVDGRVSRPVWNLTDNKDIPSFHLTEQWPQVVAEQYQLTTVKYHESFSGKELMDKLQELDTVKYSLLSDDTMPELEKLLKYEQYENFYRILDLDPAQADIYTATEIKRARDNKLIHYHPDRNHGVTDKEKQVLEESFNKIMRAAELLLDPNTKARVDGNLLAKQKEQT